MDSRVYISTCFIRNTFLLLDFFPGDMANPTFQTNRKFHCSSIETRNIYSRQWLYLATWQLYYSARATYGPLVPSLKSSDALTPSFWHKVTEAFAVNDAAFQKYIAFKKRGINVQPCDAECKRITICDLRALRAENNCVSIFTAHRWQQCSYLFLFSGWCDARAEFPQERRWSYA